MAKTMKCDCGRKLKKDTINMGLWKKAPIKAMYCEWCGNAYCLKCGFQLIEYGTYWFYCPKCEGEPASYTYFKEKYFTKEKL